MTSMPWGKFFWRDYAGDLAVRSCSLAAQGLWMQMLCIAAQHDPIGYVAVNGRALDGDSLAKLLGQDNIEVNRLLEELSISGVYSVRDGMIFNRRMVVDYAKHVKAVLNGSKGGNPSLGKHSTKVRSVNHLDKPQVKPGVIHLDNGEVKLRSQKGRKRESVIRTPSDSQYGNRPRTQPLVIEKIATSSLKHVNSLDVQAARNGAVSVRATVPAIDVAAVTDAIDVEEGDLGRALVSETIQ